MTDAKSNPLHQALFRILRPMARLLLRNGVPFGEFSELVKDPRIFQEGIAGDILPNLNE